MEKNIYFLLKLGFHKSRNVVDELIRIKLIFILIVFISQKSFSYIEISIKYIVLMQEMPVNMFMT